jgi:hypothetical protein
MRRRGESFQFANRDERRRFMHKAVTLAQRANNRSHLSRFKNKPGQM